MIYTVLNTILKICTFILRFIYKTIIHITILTKYL